MKKVFFLISFLILMISAYAQPGIQIVRSTEKQTINGKEFYLHTVEKGQTLYSIARIYQVEVKDILYDTVVPGIQIGEIIKIPVKKGIVSEVAQTPKQESVAEGKEEIILHKVQSGDAVFALARQYKCDPKRIFELNPEAEKGIKIGQELKIPVKDPSVINTQATTKPAISKPKSDVTSSRVKEEPIAPKMNARRFGAGETFNIALMLPLFLNDVEKINPDEFEILRKRSTDYKSFTFFQFYEGFMLAMDTLKKMGINAKIHVYDVTDDSTLAYKIISKDEMDEMDLIVGPLFFKSFEVVSKFAKQKGIPIINPMTDRRNILENNPYVFKLKPSVNNQAQCVAEYILNTYPGANILLIHNNKDADRKTADIFKKELNQIFRERKLKENSFRELIFNQVGLGGLQSKLLKDKPNVVLAITDNEIFVTNFVSKLSTIDNYNIILFATPKWKNYDKIETEYFQKLNLHLYEPWFVNYDDSQVQSFVQQFRNKYKGEPDEFGFMGFDIANYFVVALQTYGSDFPANINDINVKIMHTRYRFERLGENGGFENTFINIYKLENYKYVGVN